MTANLRCLSEQKISTKTARETVLFFIKPPYQAAFFIIKWEVFLFSKQIFHAVSLSGGKDSTAMLLLMIERDMPIDMVLTADTGMEFPEMYAHIAKLDEHLFRERGIHITTLRHPKGFEYLMFEEKKQKPSSIENRQRLGVPLYGNGWPGVKVRWCTGQLKTHLITKEVNRLKGEYQALHYVGIAADEPKRIKNEQYPLVDWGITEVEALKICYDRGYDWGGLYEIYHRCSCWCCPLQRIDELRKLRHHHPKLWKKLRNMDQRAIAQFGHIGMLYTQCFQELYRYADDKYNGRLPVPVRVIQDEWANVAQPESYPKILATCRSYNIGLNIIVQNIQNIKALYEKEWESIIGNCDTLLFLGGGNEPTSLEFVTKLLGKETIDTRTRGQTKGRSGSSSTNFQQTGRELLTMDEVRKLDTKDAILFIRGEDPVLDQKYDLKRHPNIRLTADGKAKPYIHKPQGAPNYALPDLPYAFKSLDDFDFIDMEETEHEESEQEEPLEGNEDE